MKHVDSLRNTANALLKIWLKMKIRENTAFYYVKRRLSDRGDTHTENMKEDCTLSPLIHSKDVFRKLTDSLGKDG